MISHTGWNMWSNWKWKVFSSTEFVLSCSCLFWGDPARWCQHCPHSTKPTSFQLVHHTAGSSLVFREHQVQLGSTSHYQWWWALECTENSTVAATSAWFTPPAGNSGNWCRREFQRRSEAAILSGTCSASKVSSIGNGWGDSIYRRGNRSHHSQHRARTTHRLHRADHRPSTEHNPQLWYDCCAEWWSCCWGRTTRSAFCQSQRSLCQDTCWEPAVKKIVAEQDVYEVYVCIILIVVLTFYMVIVMMMYSFVELYTCLMCWTQ